jgi:ubiquitin-protein ligase
MPNKRIEKELKDLQESEYEVSVINPLEWDISGPTLKKSDGNPIRVNIKLTEGFPFESPKIKFFIGNVPLNTITDDTNWTPILRIVKFIDIIVSEGMFNSTPSASNTNLLPSSEGGKRKEKRKATKKSTKKSSKKSKKISRGPSKKSSRKPSKKSSKNKSRKSTHKSKKSKKH